MALPVFSSDNVKITWQGITFEGLAPDTFLEFERNVAVASTSIGSDGKPNKSLLVDKSGPITITFQPNSLTNGILSGINDISEQNGVLVQGPMTVLDPSGTVLAVFEDCHIQELPTVTVGNDNSDQTRAWVFYCTKMRFISVSDPLQQAANSTDINRINEAIETIKGNSGLF